MKFGITSYFALAGALAAVATPGFAQTQPQASDEAEEQGAGDIVVTAQRRAEALRDVPVSVSVISGEKLAQTGLSNLSDVASKLPSLKISFQPGASILSIRGVSPGNNPGFEQPVGTFVDGVYRGRGRAVTAGLFDVERIEVLKGPQSTFFGNNVIAGALNITTKKPKLGETAFNVTGLYSPSDGQYIGEAGVTVPFSDHMAIRLAGKFYGMNGYGKNLATGGKLPRQRDFIGRATVLIKPSDSFTSTLRFDAGRNRDEGPPAELLNCPAPAGYPATVVAAGAPANACGRYIAAANPTVPGVVAIPFNSGLDGIGYQVGAGSNYDFKEVAWTNELDLGKVTVSSITSYFNHSVETFTPGALPGTVYPGTGSTTYVTNYEKTNQFAQELRLTSQNGGKFEYMVGGYYARENLQTDSYLGLFFGPPFGLTAGPPYTAATPVVQSPRMRQEADNYSVFGSLTFKATDALSLDLGARYTSVHKFGDRSTQFGTMNTTLGPRLTRESYVQGPDSIQAPLGRALGTGNYANPRRVDSKFMPSVKLSYKPNEDIMLYASWARGFKAGGYGSNSPVDFRPENVDSYELGLKASLIDRRLFVTATYFRGDYKDLQEGAVVIDPVTSNSSQIITNAGKSRAQGLEFSADAKLSDHIRLRADVTYLDSKYIDFKNAPCTGLNAFLSSPAGLTLNGGRNIGQCIGGAQDVTGVPRNFAAKWAGNVGLTITYPVGDSLKVTFDPQIYFTSKYNASFNIADDLFIVPSYTKFDARIGIGRQDGSWEFAVIGKNLTNKRTFSGGAAIAGSTGSIQVWTDPERSVAFQVSAKF